MLLDRNEDACGEVNRIEMIGTIHRAICLCCAWLLLNGRIGTTVFHGRARVGLVGGVFGGSRSGVSGAGGDGSARRAEAEAEVDVDVDVEVEGGRGRGRGDCDGQRRRDARLSALWQMLAVGLHSSNGVRRPAKWLGMLLGRHMHAG